jgi:hypothetical protein
MNTDEILRGLRYEQKKRENDFVGTCQTDISAMCKDAADCIESLQLQEGKITLNGTYIDINTHNRALEQLAESRRRERAATEFINKCRENLDPDYCGSCEAVKREIEHYRCDTPELLEVEK